MKGSFQRFCCRMEQNKDPPIVEGPRGQGVEVVQWGWAWGVHSYVLAWIKRFLCCSWARAVPWQGAVLSVPLTKTCLVPQQFFPIKTPSGSTSEGFSRTESVLPGYTNIPPEKSQLSQCLCPIQWGWAGPCCSWSWHRAAERGSSPSCPSTIPFQWFPGSWLQSHQFLRITLLLVFL